MHRVRRLWAAVLAVPILVLSGTVASPALADSWSPPPGAVDLLFSGSPAASSSLSVTPNSADPAPTQNGALTTVAGLSIGRIPDVGTYALSSRPTAGQVYADQVGTCGNPYYSVTGTIVVHELRYADDGTLQQIAAEVTRTCGTTSSLVWRWRSAFPYPRLSITAPAAATSEVGSSWTGDWTVRNIGTGPVTLGGFAALPLGGSLGGTCGKGLLLDPDATCTLSLTYDTLTAHTTRPIVGAGVTADNVPAVSAVGSLSLAADLVAPTLRVTGRTTTDVGLEWSPGQTSQDDPVNRYELLKTLGGVTTTVSLSSPDARSWRGELQRSAGYTNAWAVRLVTASGRRSVLSTTVSADVNLTALLGPSGGSLLGGSGSTDNTGVTLLGPDDLPSGVSVVGVAAEPDHTHLLVTVQDGSRGALWLTDLRGQGHQVVDTSAVPAATFHRAVPSPEGGRAALSTGSGAVIVVDTAARPTRASVVPGTGEVQSWSADGARLLVLGGTLQGGQAAPGLRWVTPSSGASVAVPGSAAATAAAVGRTGDVVWRQPSTAHDGSDVLQLLSGGATAPRGLWGAGCVLGPPSVDPSGGYVDVGVSGPSCSFAPGGVPRTLRMSSTQGSNTSVQLPYELDGPAAYTRMASNVPTLSLTAVDATPDDGLSPVTRSTLTLHPVVNDDDDPIGALRGSCAVDNGAPYSCPVTDFTSPALGQGRHTLTMRVVDPAGDTSAPVTVSWLVDSVAPTAALAAIPPVLAPSTGWESLWFSQHLSWSGKDNVGGSGVVSYETRYRYAFPTSPWSRQLQLLLGSDTSTEFSVRKGYSYCLSVRAADAAGNLSPWSAEKCTAAVLDDSDVTGGIQSAVPLHYRAYAYGDITPMHYADYHQSQNVSARRIGVVMTTCPTCGSLEVWQGKVRLGVVSGYSAAKTYRSVRWLPASTTYRWGQVVVKAVSKGKVAYFDGLVIGK